MRIYIAPTQKGVIFDTEVLAKIPSDKNFKFSDKINLFPICKKCVLSKKCTMEIRPACFGNDKENVSRLPIYYVKP